MLKELRRALCSARRAAPADRLLALEALAWLALARLLVLALPFRVVSRNLAGARAAPAGSTADPALLRRIGWALTAVGGRVPWRCKCLERAIAGKLMLRLRGLDGTLFLGLSRPAPDHPVLAHAWLRCGDVPIVGEEAGTQAYSVVARFSDAARPPA